MRLTKRNWRELSSERLSEDHIRALHQLTSDYRVFRNSYEAGVQFMEAVGHPLVMYILQGSCKYGIEGDTVTVSKGELIDVPPGRYSFEVLGEAGVSLCRVYRVPT